MNSQLLPSVAARELQTRRTIRESLTEWCRLCGFEPAAHHRIIIEELEAVARGECDRLAIFLPPGSAKSTYASVLFPPWLLATSPESAIIAASHTGRATMAISMPPTRYDRTTKDMSRLLPCASVVASGTGLPWLYERRLCDRAAPMVLFLTSMAFAAHTSLR